MNAPAYVLLHRSGELVERSAAAHATLVSCELCGHRCRVDRTSGEAGVCRTGSVARVASFSPHFGEEAPLVGRGGSGTVFFGSCNLECVFCQNADISQRDAGHEVEPEQLAAIMLDLQERGCENINWVSPTHVVPMALEALALAADAGLEVPLVYNTGTFDSIETQRLLDGAVDVYLADAKYADEDVARRLSGAPAYPAVMREALLEMHRQVGDLVTDGRGVAQRGLMVRHLVLPSDLAGTSEIMAFIAGEISVDTFVNVMAQYHPCHQAGGHPEIDRRPSPGEMAEARAATVAAGLTPS